MGSRKRSPTSVRRVPFIPIDGSGAQPLYQQIYAALRDYIVRGDLPSGVKLPSSRRFAQELGVSRFTVVTAFNALTAE